MCKLKVRSRKGKSWETINTEREKVRKTPSWKWSAHRGYYAGNFENTIPAMIRAKEKGFSYSECDLKFTSDGICVLCHNNTISGINANGETVTLTIAESTAEEVTALTLATIPRFGKIHPPTLDKFLDTAKLINMDIILHGGAVDTETEAKSIAKSVLASGMQGKVIYMPASIEAGGWIAEVDKYASIEMCYVGTSNIPEDLTPYSELLSKCDYVGFDLPANYPPTSEVIARIRASGLGLSYWNVTSSNYVACLDTRPNAMTLADNTDIDNGWDEEYLSTIELW